ncbi:short-chain dehydrogenase, partial [Streptomyces hayashii]
DTDMIRDADRHAVLRELRAHMPPPARRVYPPEFVARRLATAVERRRTAVYVPAWLRLVQGTRAALPPLVLRESRRELPRLEAAEPFRPTGLLGAGGRADGTAAGLSWGPGGR